jgi:hypothetical protein
VFCQGENGEVYDANNMGESADDDIIEERKE